MRAPKKSRQTGAPKIGRPAAVPQPAFEMTAEELALAIRFFSACRRMSDGARRNCLIFADVAEQMAAKRPLHPVAKLSLVPRGGA